MCRSFGDDYLLVGVYDPETDRLAIVKPFKDEYGQWTNKRVVRCRGRQVVRDSWDEAIATAYQMAGR